METIYKGLRKRQSVVEIFNDYAIVSGYADGKYRVYRVHRSVGNTHYLTQVYEKSLNPRNRWGEARPVEVKRTTIEDAKIFIESRIIKQQSQQSAKLSYRNE